MDPSLTDAQGGSVIHNVYSRGRFLCLACQLPRQVVWPYLAFFFLPEGLFVERCDFFMIPQAGPTIAFFWDVGTYACCIHSNFFFFPRNQTGCCAGRDIARLWKIFGRWIGVRGRVWEGMGGVPLDLKSQGVVGRGLSRFSKLLNPYQT